MDEIENLEVETEEEQIQTESLIFDESPPEVQMQEIILANDQLEKLLTYKDQKEEQVVIYFSLIIGLIIGYIAVRGLLDNWRHS